MLERFTEKARRVILFARYEASVYGSESVDTPHLLLGLLREDKGLFFRLLRRDDAFGNAAQSMGLHAAQDRVTAVDAPLSPETNRVMAMASEEMERLGHSYTSTGHLLLGLLREPGAACDLLERNGLRIETVRAALLDMDPTPPGASANQKFMDELRASFDGALSRLTPELEPAVWYSARAEKYDDR